VGALALAVPLAGQAQVRHDNGNVEFGIAGRGFLADEADLAAGIISANFNYPAGDPNARNYLEGWSGIWLGGPVGPVASHLDLIDGAIFGGEWLQVVTGAPEDVSSSAGRQSIRTEFGAAPTETSDLPFTVFIEQVTHTWADGPESHGVVFIMTLNNQSDLPAEDLRLVFATNWDVDPQVNETGQPSRDLVTWDGARQAAITFQGDTADGVDTTHVATVLLQGALYAHRVSPFLPQTPWLWPDSQRTQFLSSPRINADAITPNNYQTMTVAGPVTLDGLGSHTFVFALVGGATRGDLERNIDAIANVIRQPQSVSTTVNDDGVQVVWESPMRGDIVGYAVFRAPEEGGPYDQVGPRIVTTVEYLDRSVRPGTTYFYTVRPVGLDERIVNVPSTPVSATTSPKPTAVSTLALTIEGSPSAPEIAIALEAPSDVDPRDVDLLLLRNETGFEPFTVIRQGSFTEALRDVEIDPGRTYYYGVRLVNEFERLSEMSNVVRVEVPLPVAAPSLDLRRVDVYPNPVHRSRDQALHFRNLPVGTTIRIYTATGERVDRFNNQGSSIFDWTPGSNLANGVYVYQIEWAPEAVSRDAQTAPRDTALQRSTGKFVLID
jgi:hypothetical protein